MEFVVLMTHCRGQLPSPLSPYRRMRPGGQAVHVRNLISVSPTISSSAVPTARLSINFKKISTYFQSYPLS